MNNLIVLCADRGVGLERVLGLGWVVSPFATVTQGQVGEYDHADWLQASAVRIACAEDTGPSTQDVLTALNLLTVRLERRTLVAHTAYRQALDEQHRVDRVAQDISEAIAQGREPSL